MSKIRVAVKHSVKSDATYCEELFNLAVNGYKQVVATVYPSVEAESAALALVRDAFKIDLDAALSDAYEIGAKIGSKKADTTDTSMYTVVEPAPIA